MAKDEYDPFERAISVLHQMNRWMGGVFERRRSPGDVSEGEWQPATDVYETPEGIVVCMEVAGVDPSSIEVRFSQGELTVSGYRAIGCGGGRCHLAEIENGRFLRRVTIAPQVDGENIKAQSRHGLLEILLPMKSPIEPRKISITDDSEQNP